MDQLEPCQVAARELLAVAELRGIDLRPLWLDWVFRSEDRTIYFWQEEGKYHYTLEGEIGQATGTTAYGSFWGESGVIGGIDDAVQLLSAWLLDRKEVGELPMRDTISHGTN